MNAIHLILPLSALASFGALEEPDRIPPPIKMATVPITLSERFVPIEIFIDGSMKFGSQWFDWTGRDDEELDEVIAAVARRMDKATLGELFGSDRFGGPMIPAEALVIRADENAPFSQVQKVIELARARQIWKFEFEVSLEDKDSVGVFEWEVPESILAKDFGPFLKQAESELFLYEVTLAVETPGRKVVAGDPNRDWDESSSTRFDYVQEERGLTYTVGSAPPNRYYRMAAGHCWMLAADYEDALLRIRVEPGVTFGEVLRFWDRVRARVSTSL